MTADPDEDAALAWAGDEPLVEPSSAVEPASVVEPVETDQVDARTPMPAPLLITYGILVGIYLIYTLGWVITVQRLDGVRVASSDALGNIMFQLGEALAMTSPVIWLAAVFLLTRGRKPIVRLLWGLIGLLAVLPWPFVLGAWA
jgi:hypothetical protein